MGCIGSKQKKLDLSGSSTSPITTKQSNRKPPPKAKVSPPNKQAKPRQTKAKPAATAANDKQNVDQIDGNKVTIIPPNSSLPMQSQQLPARPTTTTTTRSTGWTDEQLLSQLQYLDFDTSSNIVRLFDEGNTIPFMCRYRRELIDNLDADKYVGNEEKNY